MLIVFPFFFSLCSLTVNTVCLSAASPSSTPSSPKLPSATQSPSSSGGGVDRSSPINLDNGQKHATGNGLDRQSSGNDNEHTPTVESTTETVPATSTNDDSLATDVADTNHVTDNNNGKVSPLTNGNSNDNSRRSAAAEATLAAGKAAGNNNDNTEEQYDIPVGEFYTQNTTIALYNNIYMYRTKSQMRLCLLWNQTSICIKMCRRSSQKRSIITSSSFGSCADHSSFYSSHISHTGLIECKIWLNCAY